MTGRKVLKVLQVFIIIVLVIMILMSLYTIIARFFFKNNLPKVFGFAQVVVVSGSMEPTYQIGDMLIIHEEKDYRVNDIVTYHWGNTFVTHRVIGVASGETTSFLTKGDFNNTADEQVPLSDMVGKVVLRLPWVGNITLFLKTPIGIFTMVFIIFALYKLPDMVGRANRSRK